MNFRKKVIGKFLIVLPFYIILYPAFLQKDRRHISIDDITLTMTRIIFCTLCFRHSAFIPHTTIFASDIRQSADTLVRKMAHLHNLALNKIIAAKSVAYTEFTVFSCHHLELIILKVLEHTTMVGFPTSHQFLAHSQTTRCINRRKRDHTI